MSCLPSPPFSSLHFPSLPPLFFSLLPSLHPSLFSLSSSLSSNILFFHFASLLSEFLKDAYTGLQSLEMLELRLLPHWLSFWVNCHQFCWSQGGGCKLWVWFPNVGESRKGQQLPWTGKERRLPLISSSGIKAGYPTLNVEEEARILTFSS